MTIRRRLEDIYLVDVQNAGGLSSSEAEKIINFLHKVMKESGDGHEDKMWQEISRLLLKPVLPFPLHELLYDACYCDWKEYDRGPPFVWKPLLEEARLTNLGRLMEVYGQKMLGDQYSDPISDFNGLHRFSVHEPERYWPLVFQQMGIVFRNPPSCILDQSEATLGSSPGGIWLPDVVLNAADSCLWPTKDGVLRNDSRTAVVWRNEWEDADLLHRVTLRELRELCSTVAHALGQAGLSRGSRVAVCTSMNLESVAVYLGAVMAGCVLVSIPDSFSCQEISTRLRISGAVAVFTQDFICRGKLLPLYSRVVQSNAPKCIVIPAKDSLPPVTLREGDLHWKAFLGLASAVSRPTEFCPVALPGSAMSNILFSSGTTGTPKAIPWTHVTPLKAASDAWAHNDVGPADVMAWPTNLGWMMGPYLIYASLYNGAAMALYNGAPTGLGFAKFVQDAKVSILGLVPSLVKAWRASDCLDGLDWSSIRCFSSTGEASNPSDFLWLMSRSHYRPVMELCGGTEIGGGFSSGTLLQPQALSTFSTPVMGCQLVILDDENRPTLEDECVTGELAVMPSILGSSSQLLNADHFEIYFKGMPTHKGRLLRRHGDQFERLRGGYFRAHGRVDDTMNLGGVKVSSVEIERVCNSAHKEVVETAAIGVTPQSGGPEQLVVVAVIRGSDVSAAELQKCFSKKIQSDLNPLFKVHEVAIAPFLPRTASNKVMRRVLRAEHEHRLQKSKGSLSKL